MIVPVCQCGYLFSLLCEFVLKVELVCELLYRKIINCHGQETFCFDFS